MSIIVLVSGWLAAVACWWLWKSEMDYATAQNAVYQADIDRLNNEADALAAVNLTLRQQVAALGEMARTCEAAQADFMQQVRTVEASMCAAQARARTPGERDQVVDDATRRDAVDALNAPLG